MGIIVKIGNLDTAEALAAQYAPEEWTEKYAAEWTELPVPGLTYEPLQFSHNKNAVMDLKLRFNQLVNPKISIAEQRKMLLAMQVKSRKTDRPPMLLYEWPGMVSMRVIMPTLEMTHTYFAPDGATAMFEAKIVFKEARDSNLYAEDVRAHGTVRMG